jgi:hypothetical protein
LCFVVFGCEFSSLTLGENHRLTESEDRVLRRIFGLKTIELTGGWINYIVRSLVICIHDKIFLGDQVKKNDLSG